MNRFFIITALSFAGLAAGLPAAAGEYSVDDCVKLALERSDRIKEVEAELDYYRGRYHEALWNFWLPRVSATVMGGGPVAKQDKEITRVTDVSNLGALGAGNGFVIQGSVDLVWPIYTFGKLGFILDAATSGVDAAREQIASARNNLVLDTRKAYYSVILTDEIVAIIEDGRQQLMDARKKIKELLDADDPQATEKDLFKIDYYAAELISRLEEAKKGRSMSEAALKLLIGADPDDRIEIKKVALDAGLEDLKPLEGYMGEAQEKRPDLRALSHAVKARSEIAKAAGRAYYPDFFLGGGLRFSWTNVDYGVISPLLRDDLNYLGGAVGLGVRLDLDIGTKYAQEEQAKAELAKIRLQSKLAERGVALQVKKAYADYTQARSTYLAYKTGERAAKKWLVSTMMNYNIGLGDTKDMLDALVAHAQAKLQLLKAAFDAKVSLAELVQSTGSGTK
jgi:outer membrane protein TolC